MAYYDNTVDKKTVMEAQQLVMGLPNTLNMERAGYLVTKDDFTVGMARDAFDSVVAYCLELVSTQIRNGRDSAKHYATTQAGLENLLPEKRVFGVDGLTKKRVLTEIYGTNNDRTTH